MASNTPQMGEMENIEDGSDEEGVRWRFHVPGTFIYWLQSIQSEPPAWAGGSTCNNGKGKGTTGMTGI